MKVTRRISASFASVLGYVLLLLAFAALGLFVAALATGGDVAAILGVVLIACLTGSVLGFRAASHTIAQSRAIAAPASAVSIFSTPLRQDQIDRYLENYRGETGLVDASGQRVVAGSRPRSAAHCSTGWSRPRPGRKYMYARSGTA